MTNTMAIAQARSWHLRALELFAGVPAADIQRLGEQVDSESFPAGAEIYDIGDLADRVYVVKSGLVKVACAAGGQRDLIVHLAGPDEIFGECGLTGVPTRENSATALSDVFAFSIDRRRLEEFLLRNPRVTLEVFRLIAERKRRADARLLEIATMDVRTRLASTLAALAKEYGRFEGRSIHIDVPLTQTDLAQLVGSTRETVSTLFNEFRRADQVSSQGKDIWVTDLEALERCAHEAGWRGRAA